MICLSVPSCCLPANDCVLCPFLFPLSPHPPPGTSREAEEYAVEGKRATLHSAGPWHAADLSAAIFAVAGCSLMLCALPKVGSIVSLDCGYKTFRGPKFSPMISSCLFNLIMLLLISFEIFYPLSYLQWWLIWVAEGSPWGTSRCLVHLYEQTL